MIRMFMCMSRPIILQITHFQSVFVPWKTSRLDCSVLKASSLFMTVVLFLRITYQVRKTCCCQGKLLKEYKNMDSNSKMFLSDFSMLVVNEVKDRFVTCWIKPVPQVLYDLVKMLDKFYGWLPYLFWSVVIFTSFYLANGWVLTR